MGNEKTLSWAGNFPQPPCPSKNSTLSIPKLPLANIGSQNRTSSAKNPQDAGATQTMTQLSHSSASQDSVSSQEGSSLRKPLLSDEHLPAVPGKAVVHSSACSSNT